MNPNDLSVYVYHKCPDSSFPTKMSSVTTVHLKNASRWDHVGTAKSYVMQQNGIYSNHSHHGFYLFKQSNVHHAGPAAIPKVTAGIDWTLSFSIF
jgi:hypothetical protein